MRRIKTSDVARRAARGKRRGAALRRLSNGRARLRLRRSVCDGSENSHDLPSRLRAHPRRAGPRRETKPHARRLTAVSSRSGERHHASALTWSSPARSCIATSARHPQRHPVLLKNGLLFTRAAWPKMRAIRALAKLAQVKSRHFRSDRENDAIERGTDWYLFKGVVIMLDPKCRKTSPGGFTTPNHPQLKLYVR